MGMSDDLSSTEVSSQLGMSRRDLIRRGAILGGTLVWAAPAVQTFARPAFGQDTNGTPLEGLSWVGAVVNCGTEEAPEYKRVKANYNGAWVWECEPGPDDLTTQCDPDEVPVGWAGAEKVVGGTQFPTDKNCPDTENLGITIEYNDTDGDGKIDWVRLCLPNGDCKFVMGTAGIVKEATTCNVGTNGGNCLTFTGPF